MCCLGVISDPTSSPIARQDEDRSHSEDLGSNLWRTYLKNRYSTRLFGSRAAGGWWVSINLHQGHLHRNVDRCWQSLNR